MQCLSAFPGESEILFPPRSVLLPITPGAGPSLLDVSIPGESDKRILL